MTVKARGDVGEFDEVVSGSVTLLQGVKEFEVSVLDLVYVFQFLTDDARKDEQEIKQVASSGKQLTVGLVNFNNPLGTTFESQVGTVGGAELHAALYVVCVGDGPAANRMVVYSFFKRATK